MSQPIRPRHRRFAQSQANNPADQRVEGAMAPCRTGTGEVIEAAGERIVAFGRSGKSPETRFLHPIGTPLRLAIPPICGHAATVSKA